VKTLARALKIARRSDRIILAKTPEPYRESVTVHGKNSGVPKRPFVIEGNGAMLDGTEPVPNDAWENVKGDLFRYPSQRKRNMILYRGGQPLVRIAAKGDDLPDLEPLQWTLHKGHVYFRVEAKNLPTAYQLRHSVKTVGITIYEARHIRIENLVIQGYQLDGVNSHDSVFDTVLVGMTVRGNGRSGISVGGASRVVIQACLVGNNVTAQIRTEGRSRTRIIDTDIVHEEFAKDIDKEKNTFVERKQE